MLTGFICVETVLHCLSQASTGRREDENKIDGEQKIKTKIVNFFSLVPTGNEN